MADEHKIARYRNWYRRLLRCYSRPYRERFAEGMEQTFHDACRERSKSGAGLFGFVLWVFIETSASIVRENVRFNMMHNKNIIRIAVGTALLLSIPLLAGAPWSLFDFVIAGGLLFGTGVTFELIARRGRTTAYRLAVGVACATGLLLTWINLAVGIIGSENNPVNQMFFGVLAVGIVGAFLARFQPRRMARALFATAAAQALVPVMALLIVRPANLELSGVVGVFVLNAFFVVMWIVSAILFRRTADPWSDIDRPECGPEPTAKVS